MLAFFVTQEQRKRILKVILFMLPKSRVIKLTARTGLRGHWPEAMAVTVILSLSILFAEMFRATVASVFGTMLSTSDGRFTVPGLVVMLFVAVIVIFFSVPLCLGVVRWFWNLSGSKVRPIREIFYYYSEWHLFTKSVFTAARLLVKVLWAALLCYLPAWLVWALTQNSVYELIGIKPLTDAAVLWPLLYLFCILSTLVLLKIILRYLLAPILVILDEDLDPGDAVNISKTIAKTHKNAYVYIFLSFLGWIAFSAFGVTLLYTLPFLFMSYAVFARFAISNHWHEAEREGVRPAFPVQEK